MSYVIAHAIDILRWTHTGTLDCTERLVDIYEVAVGKSGAASRLWWPSCSRIAVGGRISLHELMMTTRVVLMRVRMITSMTTVLQAYLFL